MDRKGLADVFVLLPSGETCGAGFEVASAEECERAAAQFYNASDGTRAASGAPFGTGRTLAAEAWGGTIGCSGCEGRHCFLASVWDPASDAWAPRVQFNTATAPGQVHGHPPLCRSSAVTR
jgi:hypothetical protein